MSWTLAIFFILALTVVQVASSGDSDVKEDMHGNDIQDRAIGPRVDNLATHITPRYAVVPYVDDPNAPDAGPISSYNRTPVIDSLPPAYHPSQVPTSSNHQKMVTITITLVVVVGLCAVAVMVFFLVRYYMRRVAIKRRRQASWILRSGQWNTEAKQAEAHGTRTGCSDTSSFSAYPYPLSEHF